MQSDADADEVLLQRDLVVVKAEEEGVGGLAYQLGVAAQARWGAELGQEAQGIVEAACKTLVTQRLKQRGVRWDEAGGQAILTVRGWTQSGDRFDRAWAMLAATYQAEVVTLHNVVPSPPGGRQKGR